MYVLVEQPQALIIYDHFKNPLPEKKREALGKNVPFLVIERNLTFEDGLTNAMRVSFENSEYYIGKDADGAMLNYKNAGKIELVKQARHISEPAQLLAASELRTLAESSRLEKGELLTQIFAHGRRTYVKTSAGNYGFLPANRLGKPAEKSAETHSFARNAIAQQIERSNQKIAQLFSALSAKNGVAKKPPQIELIEQNSGVKIVAPERIAVALFREILHTIDGEYSAATQSGSSLTIELK